MAEFVLETILRSLTETWQEDDGIELKLGEPEPNLRRTKRFRPTEPIAVGREDFFGRIAMVMDDDQ